jgi:hypothetical protein
MISIINKYNISDDNLKKCLQELETAINKELETKNKIYDKDITKDDYKNINEGEFIFDKKSKRILTRYNNILYKAELTEL